MNYYNKYLKYKTKYLNKKQIGGNGGAVTVIISGFKSNDHMSIDINRESYYDQILNFNKGNVNPVLLGRLI